jgi:hypothetical protein
MKNIDVGSTAKYGFGNDAVVIRNYIAGIIGGVVLDTDGFKGGAIRCGHIIICDAKEEHFKPLNVTAAGKYESLPSSYKYAGVATTSKDLDDVHIGCMYAGEVNDVASPYPVTDEMKTAIKAELPQLVFKHDKVK